VSGESGGPSSSELKLPTIIQDYFELLTFKNTFAILIINNTDIQRLCYLIASLVGEAKGLIETIAITPDNFHMAWKLLVDRYNNPKIIAAWHVKA
jgi:hypothetical protein